MIRRVLFLMMVSSLCIGQAASAADLPSWTAKKAPSRLKLATKPKPAAVKLKKQAAKPSAAKPSVAKLDSVEPDLVPSKQQELASREVEVEPSLNEPSSNEMDLAWVLDPLVANADGGKKEDSASIEGNLIVVEPGYVSAPYMVIELTGHIVKTPDTTARIDVRIGGTYRTVAWKSDDVQSGKFKIELKAPMTEGKLPAYFPVSALAFVTNDRKAGAAMVSLEKIVVRVGKVTMVSAQ